MLKKLITYAVCGALILAPIPAAAKASNGPELHRPGWCLDVDLKVSPAPGAPRDWTVATTYCQPFRWAHGVRSRHIDVLTHGATYTRQYWDWPEDSQIYSYVDRALADGRAVLNYDRIGNGDSTRPLSTEITMATDAYVLHQLIGLLRLLGFRHIASVSHSYGSGVALEEAARYNDVSTVVLSGYLHRPSNPAVTAGNYPANQDPKFAAAGLDNGWLTTRPGVRGTSFHSASSDPAVITNDEERKDLVSLTGLLGFLGARGVPAGGNVSNLVTVPVLVVVGQEDFIFCYNPATFDCANQDALEANELPFYEHASAFKVISIQGSGHDLTLHPSAPFSYNIISEWVSAQ